MNKLDNPCRNCTGRSAECHPTCEKYLSWKERYIEEQREIIKYKASENLVNRVIKDNIDKTKRGRHGRNISSYRRGCNIR